MTFFLLLILEFNTERENIASKNILEDEENSPKRKIAIRAKPSQLSIAF